MVARLRQRCWHYGLLLAVGLVLFLWNLGGPSLWDMDEGKNATAALEMYESGNWVVPTFNGELRADKPALLYWLQIVAYRVFGIGEFAARLPSALAALAALLLAYELGRALFGETTGLLTGLIAASTPMVCGAARFANPDALLHFFTLLTMLIFWLGHERRSRLWWLSLGAATGFGMLAKGPVGVVLPSAVIFFLLLWEGRVHTMLHHRLVLAILAWCLVALPWYIWVVVDTKANFLRGFILRHNIDRFLSPMENHTGSPLYYLLVLLIGMAPWSIFLGGALWCALWSVRRQPPNRSPQGDEASPLPTAHCSLTTSLWQAAADRQHIGHPEVTPPPAAAYRFLLTWIATYLVFFSIAATKLPNYVLPVVVPCAVLTARFLDRWRRGQLVVPTWSLALSLVCLALIGAGVGVGLTLASGLGDLAVLQGRFIPGLTPWGLLGAVPLAGAFVGWKLWRQERRNELLACWMLAAVVLIAPFAAWGSVAFNDVKAPRPLVEQAGALQRDHDIRIGAWQLEHLPSLNFYVQRDVLHLQTEAELRALLSYPLPVYVFLPSRVWQQCAPACRRLGREVARHTDFYRHREIVVVTNQ
jgi:4-amino-4-deoxy-L-arabinose transferase-like glycosyltransferase